MVALIPIVTFIPESSSGLNQIQGRLYPLLQKERPSPVKGEAFSHYFSPLPLREMIKGVVISLFLPFFHPHPTLLPSREKGCVYGG
jgi:hypothetical protein